MYIGPTAKFYPGSHRKPRCFVLFLCRCEPRLFVERSNLLSHPVGIRDCFVASLLAVTFYLSLRARHFACEAFSTTRLLRGLRPLAMTWGRSLRGRSIVSEAVSEIPCRFAARKDRKKGPERQKAAKQPQRPETPVGRPPMPKSKKPQKLLCGIMVYAE